MHVTNAYVIVFLASAKTGDRVRVRNISLSTPLWNQLFIWNLRYKYNDIDIHFWKQLFT